MIEFQHFKKLFLSKGLDPFGPFRSRFWTTRQQSLAGLLARPGCKSERQSKRKWIHISFCWSAKVCSRGSDLLSGQLLKFSSGQVLQGSCSPARHPAQSWGFTARPLPPSGICRAHVGALAAVPGSRRGTWWWRRRAAASGSTASAAGAASASPARRGGSWRAARRGSPPPARTRSLPAARAKSAVTACQTLPPGAFELFLAK